MPVRRRVINGQAESSSLPIRPSSVLKDEMDLRRLAEPIEAAVNAITTLDYRLEYDFITLSHLRSNEALNVRSSVRRARASTIEAALQVALALFAMGPIISSTSSLIWNAAQPGPPETGKNSACASDSLERQILMFGRDCADAYIVLDRCTRDWDTAAGIHYGCHNYVPTLLAVVVKMTYIQFGFEAPPMIGEAAAADKVPFIADTFLPTLAVLREQLRKIEDWTLNCDTSLTVSRIKSSVEEFANKEPNLFAEAAQWEITICCACRQFIVQARQFPTEKSAALSSRCMVYRMKGSQPRHNVVHVGTGTTDTSIEQANYRVS
ncbi:hypothetical protein OBBRIDRAFT_885644 [Obba rivulosa]|uniref:Uncharacterized protein n=1 Tax=Obba rivulosa TaxID=1052685 RepID=A0A8E2DP94_9APHY|nr:hypothetical protein OBBRIDRAFT_885644 [Obba rivulosa]